VILVWAWVAQFLLAQFIVGTMAELCSSMPTAGGLFSWSFQLGGRYRRFWTWITGTGPTYPLNPPPPFRGHIWERNHNFLTFLLCYNFFLG